MMSTSPSPIAAKLSRLPPKHAEFYSTNIKAVVGASSDRSKFGNKVLRCYLENGMLPVPINKRSASVEGIDCIDSLSTLKLQLGHDGHGGKFVDIVDMKGVGVSIITPPGVTRLVMEEAYALGCTQFFLQPGTHDQTVDDFVREKMSKANVVKGCVLVDLDFSHSE